MADVTKLYVIDASVALAFLLPDEIFKEKARELIQDYSKGRIDLIVPPLLFNEVANGLKTSVTRKRVSSPKAESLLKAFLKLEIPIFYSEPLVLASLEKALDYNITTYDAAYVALAQEEKCQFVTADTRLFNTLKNTVAFIRLLKNFK